MIREPIARSLTLKLTLVIMLVGLVGVAVVAFFAQQATRREFSQFIVTQARTRFTEQISGYYQAYGTLEGVKNILPPPPPRAGQPAPQPPANQPPARQPATEPNAGEPAPPPPRPRPLPRNVPPPVTFILLDNEGCVLTPTPRYQEGACLAVEVIADAEPMMVNGEQVGQFITVEPQPQLGGIEQAYLSAINSSLRTATLTALALALVLGLLLARYLTRPLNELTRAIRAMTAGKLKQEVAIPSKDELGELATAFNQMSADLDHANHLRRQMTADIAHDLRNPLVVLSGYIESMRTGVLKPTQPRLDTMQEEVNHLQHLVDDLWTLARADAGELQLNRVATQPVELLQRTAASYAEQAKSQQIEMSVEAQSNLDSILADPERIVQVLNNLVSNALRYTPKGGQIRLLANRAGNALELAVQDNGQGIAPDAVPLIFERFYRDDSARTQNNGESGLGLAIAKSIVVAHDGEISVESKPNEQTIFRIRLPLAI